ncbi:MAG: tRNA 2-thiouridine(34) synthase MnmA [Myxococcales bacterium]|nr:tRNA 2-thiouridine(34) synthase MnmA [Myxococcales bacterium]
MKVAVLVSGGVDSSVALYRLREEGHDLCAFYLKIWLEDDVAHLGDCPWETDLTFVRDVCAALDVPLRIVSLQREYWDNVVQYTIDEVQAGRTPNPDIFCNHLIKFGKFYERIGDEFDAVATGHYARKRVVEGVHQLCCAEDPRKDQTYFLAHLTQEQLRRALFPIGSLPKAEVRALAERVGLPTATRRDSQGICFLGTIRFSEFIAHHLGERRGELIEFESGERKGFHRGYWYFTIGQRHGIGLHGGPWYVVRRDVEGNRVYISRQYHSSAIQRNRFRAEGLHWISGYRPPLYGDVELRVKVRHGEHAYGARVAFAADGSADVRLDSDDQGLAAGQFAVFYDQDLCLGSGVIVTDGAQPLAPS